MLAETTVEGVLRRAACAAYHLTVAKMAVSGHGYKKGTYFFTGASKSGHARPCVPGEWGGWFGGGYSGVCHEILQARVPLRLTAAELERHPQWHGLPQGHPPLRGILGVPLLGHKGEAVGLLMVTDKKVRKDFTADDEMILCLLASITTLALQRLEALERAEILAVEMSWGPSGGDAGRVATSKGLRESGSWHATSCGTAGVTSLPRFASDEVPDVKRGESVHPLGKPLHGPTLPKLTSLITDEGPYDTGLLSISLDSPPDTLPDDGLDGLSPHDSDKIDGMDEEGFLRRGAGEGVSAQGGETLQRLAADSLPFGVAILRERRIVFANLSLARMLGVADDTGLMGKDLTDFFEKVIVPVGAGSVRGSGARSEGSIYRARCLPREDGIFWVEVENRAIVFQGQPMTLAILRDITPEMEREQNPGERITRVGAENVRLRTSLRDRYRLGGLIGKSSAMQKLYELILEAAAYDEHVCIIGEPGTGKELVARAIHGLSKRSQGPFVEVGCQGMPDSLLGREYLGDGAQAAGIESGGYLRGASGGTLFLKDAGDISQTVQLKILKAVETDEPLHPLASSQLRRVDIRIIAGMDRSLSELIRKGVVLEEFFNRIGKMPIVVPPLREHKEDIPLLVEHFMRAQPGIRKASSMPGSLLDVLINYDWPGNVRELLEVIQRYRRTGSLDFLHIGAGDRAVKSVEHPANGWKETALHAVLEHFERDYLLQVLNRNHWHKGKTAAELEIDVKTLYRKMARLGL